MPALLVRLMFGEMGEEFILASRRVQPAKLLEAGYHFRFPGLADALRHEKEAAPELLKAAAPVPAAKPA